MKISVLLALAAHVVVAGWGIRPAAAQKARTTAPQARGGRTSESAPLAALFEAYWEGQARLFPLNATSEGDNRYNDQLPNDQTQAFRQRLRAFYQQYQAALRKMDRRQLSAADQTSYDILAYDLDLSLARLQQNAWLLPFSQTSGLPSLLGQLGAGTGAQPFATTQDYRNWLGRVQGFPVWADSAISNFRRGARAGVVLPRVLVEKMIPQLESFVVADASKSLFYGPVARFPAAVPAPEQPALVAAYRRAIEQELVPSYRKLAQYLKTEYLPQARATSGLNAVPGGAQRYAFAVRSATTTDQTPAQIHQTGLREVQRIRTGMEQLRQQVGFAGDLSAFFEFMRTDPQFRPFKTADEVLTVYRGIQARISPGLPRLFGTTPKTAFEVRRTEAFREATASAQYNRAAPDGSRPGIFYVPIPDPAQYNVTRGMDALFLHEAIPGHHYQIALQQENTRLPRFRRFGGYAAYTEGWGLYAESLGRELGVYTDPYQQVGALTTEMHRAVRLVVDTGLHTGELTREQAIRYMLDNMPINEQRATAEIERYMANPGQALSYKIGALKIQELRTRYEQQLGARFSLRAFHDELLAGGAMPLAVLERRMDAWAARQK
ncbi:DUF885 domain-containing protein [Hymenobacter algoricola]|uniref:DUF885 family protein n=1 Tax=Hymenobacter algoricola TaxID=486267 RepID=A0ABP7M9K4_9BACT